MCSKMLGLWFTQLVGCTLNGKWIMHCTPHPMYVVLLFQIYSYHNNTDYRTSATICLIVATFLTITWNAANPLRPTRAWFSISVKGLFINDVSFFIDLNRVE